MQIHGNSSPPPPMPGRNSQPPAMPSTPPTQQQYRPTQSSTSPSLKPSSSPSDQIATGDTSNIDLSQFDKDVIFDGLKKMYKKKIRPLEISSKYGHFHSPPLGPSDFDAKPMVLLLGGYSVGKTSFIRYLLGRDFPGQRIGPEPTTDRFTTIMLNEQSERVVPGAALVAQADRPFRGLSPFGNNFLSRLEGVEVRGGGGSESDPTNISNTPPELECKSNVLHVYIANLPFSLLCSSPLAHTMQMEAPILRNITLVDTPGVLSGEKQNAGRNYDYEGVMKWFAERADLIVIIFDAHKLDISDELKRVIELMKPHSDKVRILLNKADMIDAQQLMRVYGALMWR